MSDLKETRVCNFCKLEKSIDLFKTIRGKPTVNCDRCRVVFRKCMKSYRYNPLVKLEEEAKLEYTSDDIKPENNPAEMSIREYIEMKKSEIPSKLSRYSKKKILHFFDQCEPSLGEALDLIESDELKELIKIYMNTIYLESVQ